MFKLRIQTNTNKYKQNMSRYSICVESIMNVKSYKINIVA